MVEAHAIGHADDVLRGERVVLGNRLGRRVEEEREEVGHATIPEGTTVSCQQWAIHRDSTFYDDPLSYRPEHWTDEFEEGPPGFAYFPFGGGPRRCIASRFAKFEVKAILATMLRNWNLETKLEKTEFKPSISLRPDTDVTMVPTSR
ncbi:cytochrome P450 [Halorussus gelatinilyticus]|uniref:Cytochrome P450 n=1 Tax=Halorussus gelatinilyticus TaxID=2937524 RepID=A0A8U0IDU8_9EURY|nr:cytochrome P450 [Halorussus gelatinilyticus]UPV99229.1 cytochrome P450 [Halorussus gelatinilyticus]